jgi:meiotically up-regulated gene 157 (Mug157) protein
MNKSALHRVAGRGALALSCVLAALVALSSTAAAARFRVATSEGTIVNIEAAKTAHTLAHDLFMEPDGTVYVQTGDIPAMWLRDSSAQMQPYLRFATDVPTLRPWFRRVIEREARNIDADPYANAFRADYSVWERKWELDSLSYPIVLTSTYWLETHDAAIFGVSLHHALKRIVETYACEERHAACSTYERPDLSAATRGGGAEGTGLIWSGFRPSDDPTEEPFNIPQEMFAAVALRDLATLARVGYGDTALAARAVALSSRIQLAIERYGRFYDFRFGWIYVYETDGRGHVRLMDDANIPDLLAAPLYGYLSKEDRTYADTRRFALSDANPYYYRGHVVSGVGSPHTPKGWVWPLAIATRAMTAQDSAEVAEQLAMLASTTAATGFVPESVDPDDPTQFTRAEFGWANAHYSDVLFRTGSTFRTPLLPPLVGDPFQPVHMPVLVTGLAALENDTAVVTALTRLFPADPVMPVQRAADRSALPAQEMARSGRTGAPGIRVLAMASGSSAATVTTSPSSPLRRAARNASIASGSAYCSPT